VLLATEHIVHKIR